MIRSLWALVDYVLNNPDQINPLIFPPEQPHINVIWSYQNSARLDKPYVVLNYTSVDVPDHEYYGQVDASGDRVVSSWRKAVVEIQFYCGPNSYRIASRFVSKLAMDYALMKQAELDCAIGTRLMLMRMPVLLNESQYEDRAIYTFDFYYTEEQAEFVSIIETVIVEGEYEGSILNPGEITCTETITIAPVVTP